jgi:hypothetical protein
MDFKFLLQKFYKKYCKAFVGNEVEGIMPFNYLHLPQYHVNQQAHLKLGSQIIVLILIPSCANSGRISEY